MTALYTSSWLMLRQKAGPATMAGNSTSASMPSMILLFHPLLGRPRAGGIFHFDAEWLPLPRRPAGTQVEEVRFQQRLALDHQGIAAIRQMDGVWGAVAILLRVRGAPSARGELRDVHRSTSADMFRAMRPSFHTQSPRLLPRVLRSCVGYTGVRPWRLLYADERLSDYKQFFGPLLSRSGRSTATSNMMGLEARRLPLNRRRHDPFRVLPRRGHVEGNATPADGLVSKAVVVGRRCGANQATVSGDEMSAVGKIHLTSAACDATLRANLPHCRYMGEAYGKRV